MNLGSNGPFGVVRPAQLRVLACKVGLRARFFYWFYSFCNSSLRGCSETVFFMEASGEFAHHRYGWGLRSVGNSLFEGYFRSGRKGALRIPTRLDRIGEQSRAGKLSRLTGKRKR